MEFNDMQNHWKAYPNPGKDLDLKNVTESLYKKLHAAQKRHRAFLVWTFIQLVILTAATIYSISNASRFAIRSEWGIYLLLALPWVIAIGLLVLHRNASLPSVDSIKQTLVSAHSAVKLQRKRIQWIFGSYLIMIPILILSISQLHSVGKVSERDIGNMVLLFTASLVFAASILMVKYIKLGKQAKLYSDMLAQV